MTEMSTADINIRKLVILFVGLFVVITLAPFLAAGIIQWPAGWKNQTI